MGPAPVSVDGILDFKRPDRKGFVPDLVFGNKAESFGESARESNGPIGANAVGRSEISNSGKLGSVR